MLKKIASVTICVHDVAEALDFYADVFGLKPLWRDEQTDSAGLLFADTSTELILVYDPQRVGQTEVQYLVDDVISAMQRYTEQGCIVVTQPFETRLGTGAVIQDPFGIRMFLLDRGKSRQDEALP